VVVGALQGIGLQRPQADPAARLEILKGQVAQLVQVAEGKQAAVYLLADLGTAADAGLDLAEVRMPEWQIQAQVSQTPTMGAIGVARQVSPHAFSAR
jgi:hypothetical protein